MKTLKTISMLSLSAFLVGGVLVTSGADAKQLKPGEVKAGVEGRLTDTLKHHGLSGAVVRAEVREDGKINVQVNPAAKQPYSLATVIKAFDGIYEDAQKIAVAFGATSGLEGQCFIGRGEGNGNVAPEEVVKVNDYGIRYTIQAANAQGGFLGAEDYQWDGVFDRYVVPGRVIRR